MDFDGFINETVLFGQFIKTQLMVSWVDNLFENWIGRRKELLGESINRLFCTDLRIDIRLLFKYLYSFFSLRKIIFDLLKRVQFTVSCRNICKPVGVLQLHDGWPNFNGCHVCCNHV